MAAGQQYNKHLNYDQAFVKTPAIYDANLDEWLMASANVVKTDGGLFIFQKGTDDGKAKVSAELTGSTLQDAQALPMTQAQKDIVARAYENILDEIGIDNILLFLPLNETSGTTAYDLINRDIKFKINGATLGVQTPMGYGMSFDGISNYLEQMSRTENLVGNTDLALDAGTKTFAQKLVSNLDTCKVGFVRVNIKKVGAPVGTLAIEIRENNAGVPGSVITNGTSDALDVSSTILSTSYRYVGFSFSTPPVIYKNKVYWVCLKWATATTVDASNYVSWQYDSAGAYGQPRAVYDGTTWTVTSGQSHYFGLFSADLQVTDDMTMLTLHKSLYTSGIAEKVVCSFRAVNEDYGTLLSYGTYNSAVADMFFVMSADSYMELRSNKYIKEQFVTFGGTFSKSASTDKGKVYVNGVLCNKYDGTAGQGLYPQSLPFIVGGRISTAQAVAANFYGSIGAVIMTKNVLTTVQMQRVTNYLFALRKYGVGV